MSGRAALGRRPPSGGPRPGHRASSGGPEVPKGPFTAASELLVDDIPTDFMRGPSAVARQPILGRLTLTARLREQRDLHQRDPHREQLRERAGDVAGHREKLGPADSDPGPTPAPTPRESSSREGPREVVSRPSLSGRDTGLAPQMPHVLAMPPLRALPPPLKEVPPLSKRDAPSAVVKKRGKGRPSSEGTTRRSSVPASKAAAGKVVVDKAAADGGGMPRCVANGGEVTRLLGEALTPVTDCDEPWSPLSPSDSCGGHLTLLRSVFDGRPPVLYFGYDPRCGAPPRSFSRTIPASSARKLPKMYYCHTDSVHEYHAVVNTKRFGGLIKTAASTNKWMLRWGQCPKPELLRSFHPLQRANHFPASWHIGRKDLLWRNIRKFQRKWHQDFNITPASFVLPDDARSWCLAREQHPKALWIRKPSNSSCGKGIQVLRSTLDPEKEKRVLKRSGVIQRYINKPLLLHGYKFDLRLYVVVTSYDPLKIYLHEEGLVRMATEKYSPSVKSLGSRKMHLTNYSVNKHSAKYVKNQDSVSVAAASQSGSVAAADDTDDEDQEDDENGGGSDHGSEEVDDDAAEGAGGAAEAQSFKWSLKQLEEHLSTQGLDYRGMMDRIKDLIVKTCIAVEPPIVSAWHQGSNFSSAGVDAAARGVGPNQTCFEIYGFDVLVDEALAPWLLEVNTCPSVSSSSRLDKRIKTQLIADTLTLVGFSPFDHHAMEQARRAERGAQLSGLLSRPQACSRSHTPLSISSCPLAELGEAEWMTILDAHDEFMRRGSLERIFPTAESAGRYGAFFSTPRYANLVLAKWLQEGGEKRFHPDARHLLPPWIPRQLYFDPC